MAIHPTAVIDPAATVPADAEIGPFTWVRPGVTLGAGSVVGSHCVLGEGAAGELVIGERANIRSHSVIYGGSTYGPELDTGHHVALREGLTVGRNLRVGTNCDLQGHSTIGNFVRMVANVHVTQHSTIEDFVWMFAWILTTNDPHPPSDSCTIGPTIERGAVITSNVTILPGVRIGAGSFVAAGSIVTKDVAAERIVRGTPARDIGHVSEIRCTHGHDEIAYPWWIHFRRGYPADVRFTETGPQYDA
ncbi:MAG: UDP-N-acetylglucosamine acyltransferase-like protein [Thermoleophilia bacterium]|nr:UDP-N-acetylglucosamine acyltransferase-like protein [Thermoleophilia bacterium]